METLSELFPLCAGTSPVTGEFPTQRPVTWRFEVSFDLRLNKRLSKQSWGWWFETPSRSLWRHRNEMNQTGWWFVPTTSVLLHLVTLASHWLQGVAPRRGYQMNKWMNNKYTDEKRKLITQRRSRITRIVMGFHDKSQNYYICYLLIVHLELCKPRKWEFLAFDVDILISGQTSVNDSFSWDTNKIIISSSLPIIY